MNSGSISCNSANESISQVETVLNILLRETQGLADGALGDQNPAQVKGELQAGRPEGNLDIWGEAVQGFVPEDMPDAAVNAEGEKIKEEEHSPRHPLHGEKAFTFLFLQNRLEIVRRVWCGRTAILASFGPDGQGRAAVSAVHVRILSSIYQE